MLSMVLRGGVQHRVCIAIIGTRIFLVFNIFQLINLLYTNKIAIATSLVEYY